MGGPLKLSAASSSVRFEQDHFTAIDHDSDEKQQIKKRNKWGGEKQKTHNQFKKMTEEIEIMKNRKQAYENMSKNKKSPARGLAPPEGTLEAGGLRIVSWG